MTTHKIIVGNSINMSAIPNNSVNLIVTSPPYPMIEMWDEVFSHQSEKVKDALQAKNGNRAFTAMHELLNKVWDECDRVLTESGFICINIGDATRTINGQFQLYSNHTQVVNYFSKLGYNVLPDIHWRKQSNAPNKFMGSGMYPAGAYVTYEHEYILIFRKGDKRNPQGTEKELRKKSAYFWEERNTWFSDLWEIKGTSQIIRSNINARKRSAAFPFEVPYRLINMYSIENDIILDPFAGLGTTNLAAMISCRNSIGYEVDDGIASLALDTLSISPAKANKIIDERLQRHQKFIESLSDEKKNCCYYNSNHEILVKTQQEIDIQINRIKSIHNESGTILCDYQ